MADQRMLCRHASCSEVTVAITYRCSPCRRAWWAGSAKTPSARSTPSCTTRASSTARASSCVGAHATHPRLSWLIPPSHAHTTHTNRPPRPDAGRSSTQAGVAMRHSAHARVATVSVRRARTPWGWLLAHTAAHAAQWLGYTGAHRSKPSSGCSATIPGA